MINSNAHGLTAIGRKSVIGIIVPLNGKFAVPQGIAGMGPLLINNNINATPVLVLNTRLMGVKYAPTFLLNTHSSGSLLRLRGFRGLNRICAAARSKDVNRGNCIARRDILRASQFSVVCAYNPGPVVISMTGCTGTRKVRYRISLRGEVTYNINTYLYYIRGASRKRLYIYGRNPMFGVGGLL